MNRITSRRNEQIIECAKLKDKKYRDATGRFLIEGFKLFREAVASGCDILQIYVADRTLDSCREELAAFEKSIVFSVSDEVYEKISLEKSPEGILCVLKHIDKLHISGTIYKEDEKITRFMLCQIRDPGNLGTCIRSAAALGVKELVLSSDCADIYHPKCVRASMGAIFRQRIRIVPSAEDAVRTLRACGYAVYAAALTADAVKLTDVVCNRDTCFVVGNEGHGLPDSVRNLCERSVLIPMEPCSESLNASIAAALLMWECYRNG